MRARLIIEQERREFIRDYPSIAEQTNLDLILEVMLDIRELLKDKVKFVVVESIVIAKGATT